MDFPIHGLQIDDENIYDLYAMSNHYGKLNGGHYTAYCLNPILNKWFEFDDHKVKEINI